MKNSLYNDFVSSGTRDFIEESKIHFYDHKDYAANISYVMSSPYLMGEILHSSVELGITETIDLPELDLSEQPLAKGFRTINQQRRCIRNYDNAPLSLLQLSALLQHSLFVTRVSERETGTLYQRNIASPGGLYPIEVYYLNLKASDELAIGAYYYDEINKKLRKISSQSEEEFIEQVHQAFFIEYKSDINIHNASGIVVFGAVLNRVTFKYLDRGVRWAMTEAGAMVHSFQMAATALGGIGTCPCAGFFDDLLGPIINYDCCDQVPIVSMVIGKI